VSGPLYLLIKFSFFISSSSFFVHKHQQTLPENRRKPTELPTEFFRQKVLPTEIISSPNLSVFTDSYSPLAIWSVYTDGRYNFFGKLQRCDDVDFFRRFYRQNYQGIQTGIAVQWRGTSTGDITDEYTDGTCPSVIPSVKASIYPLCRHSLPLFLLLLPHPTSPLLNCSQPPIPTLPSSQHKHSSFLYFCTWSQHPFLWILLFFISKSILFSFNI